MNINKIKLDLAKMIRSNKHITFIEIEKYFNDIGYNYKGHHEISSEGGGNQVVFWSDWNKQTINLVMDLLNSNIISINRTSAINYVLQGIIINYPLYQGKKPYKQWLPVEFN